MRVLLFAMLLSVVVALFKLFIHINKQNNFGCFFLASRKFFLWFVRCVYGVYGRNRYGNGWMVGGLLFWFCIYIERIREISFGMCNLFFDLISFYFLSNTTLCNAMHHISHYYTIQHITYASL